MTVRIERVAAVEAIEKVEEEIALEQTVTDIAQLMLGLALAHALLAIEAQLAKVNDALRMGEP